MRCLVFMLFCCSLYSQLKVDTTYVDNKYREDQFYITASYNALNDKPNNINQTGFSPSFSFGVLRDMPFNKKRSLAFAIGLGYSYDSFNQNIFIDYNNDSNDFEYSLIDLGSGEVKRNKFFNSSIEIPLELRWRDSSPTKKNFLRVYTGVKFNYIFRARSKFIGDLGAVKHSIYNDFNSIQYGLTFNVGYSGVNLYAYYGLSSLFKSRVVLSNGDSLSNLSSLKFGLSFYLL
jgi:hypothetical protein